MHLPSEIWLQVLRWATYASDDLCTRYHPFQKHPRNYAVSDIQDSLKVKAVVVRVCRQWRALAVDMLYEDLHIGHEEQTLADVLERYEELGNRVRRAVLPYSSTTTTTNQPLLSVAILKRCPGLEILVRPAPDIRDILRFEFFAEGLALSSLKRLEWWHMNDAARSEGINSLDSVLNDAPNLRYLTIGGQLEMRALQPSRRLESLSTLRIHPHWTHVLFIEQICRWSLPALTHIVVHNAQNQATLNLLWEAFGHQLQTIELGGYNRFYIEDHIASILRCCPILQELNYHIHFTMPPRLPIMHSSLHSVRLHGQANGLVGGGYWEHVTRHFEFLSGPSLPALKRIILYGEWYAILIDDRFPHLLRTLDIRNCDLALPDGTVIRPPG